MSLEIHPYQPEDFEAVTRLWQRARLDALPDFERAQGHSYKDDCWYFREMILNKDQVWVA